MFISFNIVINKSKKINNLKIIFKNSSLHFSFFYYSNNFAPEYHKSPLLNTQNQQVKSQHLLQSKSIALYLVYNWCSNFQTSIILHNVSCTADRKFFQKRCTLFLIQALRQLPSLKKLVMENTIKPPKAQKSNSILKMA